MLNNPQQRKALVLSLLMVMLAQTAYVESYRGWTLSDEANPARLNAACDDVSRTAGTPIYVDASQGSDDWDGTWSCPKATLSDALNDSSSDDEIILATGLYHENVTVNGKDNLVIRAADGARVVFDGTQSIADDLNVSWGTADSNGVQETTLPVDGWQLFLAYEEQVPARWPNAQFSDETVFNRSYWAEGTLTGSNSAYTQGWLTDAGPESGVHTGLNETINATGLDPVGAIAVMNLGSFRSNSRIITDWNAGNGTFAYDGSGVGWKNKHHAYFLEGKQELIDQDGEWWFNNTNNRLYYKTPSGQDANDLDLRVKVQPFAISVENSDGVTVQGIDFFGTTVNFNECDGCSFTNATLEYPSTSKRGLGIAGESEDDRWMTRFYRSTNSFVDNISITNTDGGAIEFQGSAGQSHNNTVNNSYFHAIDWSAADQKGLMTTIYEGGRDMYFTNNTVHLTGASSVLSIGDAPKVFYNEVWDVGHLQTDGAVVQIMQGEAPGAEVAYNWIHDIIKYGVRFDAPIGQVGTGQNGTMHHNVIWNAAGGLMVKGDYHNIHNNTVFNSSASKNDIIALTDGDINNKNSTFHRNAIDSMADHRSDDVHANPLPNGTHWSNWNGYLQGYDGMFEARNQISCAIYDNGSLYCWGRNDHGQLGLGYTSGREEAPQYVDLGTGRTITSLGIDDSGAEGWAPNSHACAVLDNGELVCWGANGDGQLGIGNTSTSGVWEPNTVNVGSGLTTISVTVGNAATCALLSDHSVKCWGKNNVGQLGLGNSSNNDVLTPHAVSFSGSSNPISLHGGRNEFCAQLDNGSAACWGENAEGQLGLGNTTSQTSPISLTLPTGRTVASMSVSKDYMCLAFDNGSIACAGRNAEFQLGQGTQSARETSWKYVVGLDMVAHTVELGQDVGCAHLVNGSMACWGEDAWGLFGNSTTSYASRVASTATQYANFGNGRTAASISLNYRHACAVLDNGDLTCWGRNHKAQLGLGNTTQEFMPVVVSNVSSIRQVAVHEMLVDPANDDFRPKWGSPLHQLSAGAYDAGDADPWTAGVSWTYSPMSDPISGCMDSISINYNSNAVFSDGSCIYTTLSSSSSTLSLEVGVAMTPHTLTYSTPFLADDKQTAASSGAVGMGSNIALDSNGAVHICSKIESSDDLYYTTNASGSWDSATIDSGGNIGGDCFIILDSDNDIHITYYDDTNNVLKYATKALSSGISSTNWAISTMDNNGDVGNFGSMAVDVEDTLHVAYYSTSDTKLKYATLADGSSTWSREVVESTNAVGTHTSIALDSNGNPHITYYDDTNDDLRYAHKMGSSWAFTTLDSIGQTGKGTSLAIDSNDHLHVAYRTNNTEIAYMTNRSGSWVKTTLDANSTGNWLVNYIDIMIDEGDDVHVVYSDMVDYDVFYMSNTRGVWERILIAGDSISKSSSATMDENGGIHAAYYIDGSFDDVGYAAVRSLAHRPVFEISPALPQGLSLGAENGTVYGTPMEYLDLTEFTVWANTTRTSAFATFSMNVDWELQSSVDWLGVERNTAITPITFNWTAWSSGVANSTASVYTSGDSGWYNDIVIDSNDKAHIVFYRDDNTNIYHSTNASGSWVTSSIDTNNNVGKYCSIAIDSNDGLHVSYQYNTGNTLKYAYKSASSSSWSKTTVDNTGGKFTTIAIDSNDNPHIVYRDGGGNGGDLAYAKKTSGSWSVSSPVYSVSDVAATSIAIDSNDDVHIAYYDGASNQKKMYHLTDASGSWVRTFLETIGSNTGGTSVSIGIDPTTDEPGISYFDMSNTDLKYRSYSGSSWSVATVSPSGDYGRFNSLAYDSLGNVHISHELNGADDLYYTSDKTGSWVTTAIHTTNSVGTNTAIAVDSNDDIHIAYRYNTGTDLYVATVQGYNTGSVTRMDVSGATCSISPSLPNGLTLNQGTCTISGTPTSDGSNTTYNVTATSSTGVSKSGEFKLWVTLIAPSIAYSGSPFTFTEGAAISSITPTNTGDSAFWSASPSLPSGLSLSSTGVISGTPTVQVSATTYTITATNNGGFDTATISLTVNAQAPTDLAYSPENMTLTNGAAMSTNTPTVNGGSVTTWQMSPTLPTGLTFSTSTGAISGTPSVLQTSAVSYTVWANNSGGSTSATVNITINDVAPASVSYSQENITLTKGVSMSATTPSSAGGGGVVSSWAISPSLPSGLSIDSSTGEISGTPSVLQTTAVTYTVWANNSGGSVSVSINITINDVAPNTVVYSSHDLTLEKGTLMTTTTPASSGGSVTAWEISPAIPSGLSFSSSTGAISGTPSVLQTTAVTYTIWANNSGGSTSTQFNITINDQAASVSYPSTVEVSNDRAMTTVSPTVTGGAVTSWVIVPSLPSGLNFGSSNGSIWGTPTGLLENATYTIYANNSGGSTSITFTLGLNWTLTPSVEGAFITRNMSLSPDITWTINPSGAVSGATCAISPSLPTGLSLTAGTCTITGTPTATASNATYTVWANVSGTSYSGQIWLEVGLNAPDISYSSSTYTYTKDIEIFTLNPTNVGGGVTTWAINASLPSGLTFETSNGTIWGTPDTVTATTTYTIWANNSAGSNSTTITFTVNDPTPNFSYTNDGSTHYVLLYLNQTMNAITPITFSGGGLPTSCSSSPSLPSGMTLSSSCVISGTPNVTASFALYTITGTNTGGSDSDSIYISVLAAGGSLTVSPTSREGAVNSTLSDITMSYTHQISNYGWTSGVSNTSAVLNSGTRYGIDTAIAPNGDIVAVTQLSVSGNYIFDMHVKSHVNGTWSRIFLDNTSNSGYNPSVEVDENGVVHAIYFASSTNQLRYITNLSGSWVSSNLSAAKGLSLDWFGSDMAIDSQGNLHFIFTSSDPGSNQGILYHYTNQGGSWTNTTISDSSYQDAHYPSMALSGKDAVHIAFYNDDGSDLVHATNENGSWTMENVSTSGNIGKWASIALNSNDDVVIASRYSNRIDVSTRTGSSGTWSTANTGTGNRYPMYMDMNIDSNDDVHIIYRCSGTWAQVGNAMGDVEHITNESGSWVRSSPIRFGGYHASLEIDNNDDLHVVHSDGLGSLRLEYTTIQGTGKGLSVVPVFSVSPSLPSGLVLNWKTGTISGTPTEALANTTFTVTVTALGTTTTGTFTLYVTGAPGAIAYSDISGTKGTAITPVTPSITTNGTTGSVTSWAINASLPSGLTFETSNGTIWGTPSVVEAGAVFTVWANNSVGSRSTTVNITISDVAVTAISYPSENITLTVYHTMTTATPSTTGGTATTWGISPSLPSGMSFDSATGAISGTPENLQTTAVTYTVWANNSAGDFSDQINITINDYPPVPLNYFGDAITLDYNQTMTPISDFELRPDLMAAGEDHSCAIKDDGTVRCWGEGANGRLGYGGSADKNSPTATSSLGTGRTAIDITAGGDHTCVVLDDGSVKCWGANTFGQLGDGTTTSRTSPTQTLSLGRPAVAVEAGMFFTCALLDNGSVSCWGKNNQGQLGRGYTNSSSDLSQRTPGLTLPMPGGRHVVTMDISHYMVCGVLDDGSIACWSQYGGGQTPSLRNYFSSTNPAKDVATGRYSACGLMENGNVTCWGTGFLGTGGSGQSAGPGLIWPNLGSGRTAVHVELGRKHNCALLDNNAVKCWGDDSYGQMGNGAGSSNKNTPTSVSFASGVVVQDIIAGQWHTCIATQTNEMYCWGDGVYGKLGDGASSQNNQAGSGAKVNHFSGSNPVKAHGDITSWAVHPDLPTGLELGSSNGTLWGTPTSTMSQTNFTIYANNSGGSSSFELNLGVNAQAPGPFEYNPENNTLTKGNSVHLAPQFNNLTTGNGSAWQIANLNSGSASSNSGQYLSLLVGDTLYFSAHDGSTGHELWAHDTSNYSTWQVADIYSGSSGSNPGYHMSTLIGDTLYFSAWDGTTGHEVWAHDTSNHSTWQVADIYSGSANSNPGQQMELLVGDTLYFDADDGVNGRELWAHDTSNGTTWQVAEINAENNGANSANPGIHLKNVVGDTLYFSAHGATSGGSSNGIELWAHNTSNLTTWEVANINYWYQNSWPGMYLDIVVGDTLYFSAVDANDGHELWAHNTSNQSTWQVADLANGATDSKPGESMAILFGDTIYFDADDGNTGIELWAHDTSNHTTWQVADINSGASDSDVGGYLSASIGNTLLISADDGTNGRELWAHDTLNGTTWMTSDMGLYTIPGYKMAIVAGDTLFFDDGGSEPYAYSTSNATTWRIADINSGSSASYPGWYMSILIGDTLYFDADDGSTGKELWAFAINGANLMTNTGGAVSSYEINASLPNGLSFNTNTGVISGTPTGIVSQTAYMVWANNSGGSSVAYLNITVVDELPTLSYSPSTLVLTKGNQSSDLPLNATLTGSGTITSWAINATLPAGLSFGTTNGTIWGIPTVLQTTATTYTIWANNSGGSSTSTVTLTINDQAPGPFEYNPENNTWTNNTEVHLAPQFINQTTGNGSTWQVADILNGSLSSSPGQNMELLVGDTIYFDALDASTGVELWAHDTSNHSTWQVADLNSGSPSSYPGNDMHLLVGDTIYFSADDGSTGTELWAHDTSNHSTWQVTDIESGSGGSRPGFRMVLLVGDTLYFSANDGSTGHELWAHDTSNASTWRVTDINSGTGSSDPGQLMTILVGDTLYFSANDGSSGRELWAHDTSNLSTWQVADINSGYPSSHPGQYIKLLVGDTIYFSAYDGSTGTELWAHDTSNHSTWQVADLNSGSDHGYPGNHMQLLVGDTIYFSANDGSTEDELWAHDTSNHSTWQVADIDSGSGGSYPGGYMDLLVGDTIYFSANNGSTGGELWAHDTSNHSTWQVADIDSGSGYGYPGYNMYLLVGETLYFDATDGSTGFELWAHRPSSINYQTNTGGTVTSWTINASLPNGVSFGTNNGTIYGTPTELWTQTSYMVWANNSGGSSEAYLNITVNDQLPTLSYSPENLTLTINNQSSDLPLNATLTGSGAITSWAISPALPSGLSFGTSNGTIWGTPTSLMTLKTFTISASNSGGSVNATVNITVNDEAPDISYNPDWFVLTNNTAMSPTATPTNTGGALPSTTIDSTGFAAGIWNSIALDSNGHRHVAYSSGPNAGTYSLMYATDASGTWVSIALDSTGNVGTSPSIAIDSDDNIHITYMRTDSGNQGIKYATCSSSCSSVSSWTNSTIISLAGNHFGVVLSIDSNDDLHLIYHNGSSYVSVGDLNYATCSSSCATASSWTNITIDGTSRAGFAGIDLVIDSSDHLHVAYSLYSTRDLKYITCSSSCTSVSSWTNLSIDTVGNVGRMPSIEVDSNDDLHISYRDDTGWGLKYAWCSSSCTTASSWSNTTIANGSSYGTGSTLVGFYSDLAFDSDGHMHITHIDWSKRWLLYSTCSSSCSTNSSWSHSVLMSDYDVLNLQHLVIDSNDELNIVFYDYNDKDLEFMLLDATSQPYEYSISPDLPTGLSIDSTTGTISGTPRELLTNTTFTITVRNSGGTNTTTITIEVLDQLPGLSYSPENLTLTKNQTSTDLPLSPTLTGSGAITSWAINASLPTGVSFGTNNGTIYGTPTELWTQTSYMVWANNSGGSSMAYLNITVVDELPTLSYSPSNLTLTKGQSSTDLPLNATVTGSGAITSWAISPSLPSGLNFGTSNGSIWGTPTSLMTFKTFTIWANNSGGSSSATVNITINDEAPDISYNPDWFELTKGTAMSPTATPTNSGGAIPSRIIDMGGYGVVGEFSSIAIDSFGFKHISYGRSGFFGEDLMYATDKSGSWVLTLVDSGGSAGEYTSISVDSNDAVHISYYDVTNTNLKYATCSSSCSSASSWSKVTVDSSSGDVGEHTSISVDSNDALHISYYDATNTNLKYATCSSSCSSASSWSKVTVDSSSGDVGKYGSIAIDSNDALHISYRDSTLDDLKYATCSSSCTSASSWTTSTIDSVGNVGSRTSIAIDSNDAVHISYHDITNGDLKYATDQSGSWANTTVDSVGTVGQYTSIAIDSNDVVHISYYDATNKDLKYASNMQSSIQTGVGGVIKFVDRDTKVGHQGTSIAVDSNGDVHISYYDATNGHLKYAALQGVHPWNVYGYSISPPLPAGLSLNFTSGEISGTPTAVSTNTTYTITARNTGGANTTTITIVVDDVAPSISYSNDDIVATLNVSISPHSSPTNSGGSATSWAISPYPGPAFHFNTLNGVISGTPGILLSKTQYTVYANNSGGSSIAYVNVTINPDAPNISYSPNELNLTRFTSSSDLPLTPINTGGYTQTTALCSSSGAPKLFVVSDHEGTRHVLCGTTLYSIDLDGTQTVSANHVTGTGFGLEIDDDGHLHIGHWVYNYPYIEIHHTTNKNGSWQSSEAFNSTVGGSVSYDQQGFSMAVGSDDSIHFTYIRTTGAGNANNLYHLSNQSGSWSSALLTNTNKPTMPSLALNDDNVPHVAFSAGNSISVGKYENGSYTTLLSRSNYLDPDIAIDAQGDVHVVYRRGSYGLAYSTNASGSWQHTSLESKRHIDVRIALDSNDYPHVITASITGQYNSYRHVNYYSHDGSSWSGGNITPAISSSQQPRPDIFIDDNDVISMVYHDQSSGNLFTGTGSTIYGYSISPALPSGLHFSQSTGTISGIAYDQMNRTMFTITANNSGGSSTAYINITVDDRAPSFTYNPENLTLTNNTVSNDLPLVPTVLSGADAPTDWVLMGTLPAGLNFGTNNGTIWGTATELWTTTSYTVYGNNTGGSFNVSINITVNDQMPTLSYSPANLTLYNNTASSDLPLNVTLTGPGEITSWAIAPDLPNGLTFEPSNGTIWGIPTQRLTTTQFTVWANNSGGSSSASLNITVLHEAPMFTYSSYNLTLLNNTAMTTLSPTITGGDITSWAIEEAIPTGLTLDSISGAISGTPTVVQNRTMYQIWANNSGGSHSVYLNITIYDPAVDLQYNPENLTLTRDVTMSDLVPIYSGIVDDWTIDPGLPSGLVFTDGVISGTPDVNMTRTTYTVWANNSGGSSSHTVNITILEPIAMLDYNPENMTLVRGTQMSDMVPTVSGGMVEFWSIHPALPSGLLFDNGTVSGTPTVNMTTSMFTVYANNTGGSASHTINLTILEPSGDLSYTNITLTRNVSMAPLSPSYSGGVVEVWAIHPALPNGLNFSNGVISGTPLVNLSTYMFTVYANNSGGVASATLNLTILEPIVTLVYNPDNLTLIRGVTMNPLYPSVSGGSVEEWGIEPAPPLGITFANGVFSGTPSVNMTQTQYIVYANTTGGTAIAWVNITVLEPAVDFSYNPYNLTLTRNLTMTPATPTVSGNVEVWAIEPDLPAGLIFDNGTISGTPTVNMTTTMFTVWANTTGGPSSTTINITILEPIVDFIYSPNSLVLTRNETMNATSPVFGTDAMAEQWGISPALPSGLNFTNGTISGTPDVNMTATVYTVWANNSGGSAVAYLTITILEPLATVVYVPENITLTRGEDNASIVPILGGGMVASWSITPALPEGLLFDNGSITGVALVNSTNTTYTVSATNTGGTAVAFVNITVVEPSAVLAFNESFLAVRSETFLNATLANSGGFVASWSISPALPNGVLFWNGVLYGTPSVNLSNTTFTVWANNSGGSANITFTLEVIEPVAIIAYPESEITLVNGISRGRIVPILAGGVPDNWTIEPALPPGLTFVNGYIVGVATTNLSTTTYTVWANNSGGAAIATFELTVNQPTFYARYPLTRVVLEVNETMPTLAPIYYFGDNQNPVWSIRPELPAGLQFENGRLSGTALEASNETNYTISVFGEMVPVELFVIIEVREEANTTVESVRNQTEVEQFVLPEIVEVDDSFDMYWICFPILLFVMLLGVAAINNVLSIMAKDEDDEEDTEGDEGEGSGGGD